MNEFNVIIIFIHIVHIHPCRISFPPYDIYIANSNIRNKGTFFFKENSCQLTQLYDGLSYPILQNSELNMFEAAHG